MLSLLSIILPQMHHFSKKFPLCCFKIYDFIVHLICKCGLLCLGGFVFFVLTTFFTYFSGIDCYQYNDGLCAELFVVFVRYNELSSHDKVHWAYYFLRGLHWMQNRFCLIREYLFLALHIVTNDSVFLKI